MEFLVLGPLEVRLDGEPLDLRGSRRRALLALLILHANEVVRTDRLVDDLWGERPPENAHGALQNHVSRLRKDLGGDVLVTKPWGYVLRADPQTIDLRRFEALLAEARTLPARERRERLVEALGLWRGSALADLAGEPALRPDAGRLNELRLSALEQRIDTDLELGGHRELVAELENLVAKHPLRERLRGQLILALYRAGRQAEALETYRETRRVLVDELGIEPSPELRELEQAILRQDPALSVPPPAPEPAAPDPDSPRWRWPRSPLALVAGLLLLAAGGAAAAAILSRGGPQAVDAAPAGHSQPAASATTETEQPVSATATTQARGGAKHPRKRLPPPGTEPATTETGSRRPRLPPPSRPPPPPAVTAVSRTEPTTTTKSTKRQPAQAIWDYWLTDDFQDPAFDPGMWHLVNDGTGATASEQNGRLEFSIAPDVTWTSGNQVGTHYGTQCLVLGDFDATVDYELLEWPDRNGIALLFGLYLPHGIAKFAQVGRVGAGTGGGSESYSSDVPPRSTWPPTADRSGTLRLRRKNEILTTYYRYRNQWVALASSDARGAGNLILSFATDATSFGHQAARAAFDNFQAVAPGVDCTGFPVPPRKRHR